MCRIEFHAIPRLFALNGIKPAELPTIVPNDVDPPDLTQLAGFMTAMTSAGMQWFPDPELEKFLLANDGVAYDFFRVGGVAQQGIRARLSAEQRRLRDDGDESARGNHG